MIGEKETKRLGDVCEFFNGKAHEKDVDENGAYVIVNSKFISKNGSVRKHTNKQMFPLLKNDVVMVMSDVPNGKALAKCYLIEKDNLYSLNQRICAIRSSSFNYKFLYHLNRHPYLLKFNNGENQTNLRKNDVLSTLGAYEEQKKVVEILDQVFESIEKAKANIEKNIENANDLFRSKLNQVFSQTGKVWNKKKLIDILNIVNGYSFSSKDFSLNNQIKAIKITNVGIMEFIEDSSNNLPANFLKEYSKVKIQEGDIVLALTRTIISGGLKVAKVPVSYNNSLLNQRVAAIIPNEDIIDSNFLYYFFSSNIVYKYVLDNVNSLMQPNLSIGDLKKLIVPFSSIKVQKEIVETLNIMDNHIQSVLLAYEEELKNLEEQNLFFKKHSAEN